MPEPKQIRGARRTSAHVYHEGAKTYLILSVSRTIGSAKHFLVTRLRRRAGINEGQADMDAKTGSQREMKVVIIGAGIVGLMTALEIQRENRQVVIVDPAEPGGRQAASYGNAGWISPAAIMPVSVPGLWRRIPTFLIDRSGPFAIRWLHLPHLLPWLLRFIWAGRNWKKIEECAKVRFELCRHSPRDHQNVAAEAGVNHLIEQKGHLLLCRDKSEVANDFAWNMHRQFGVKFTELHNADLRKCEPNVSERYQYGVLIEEGCHCTDVRAYCEAIAKLIRERGGEFIRAQATGFEISSGRLTGVRIGELVLKCTQAVVTAGVGSKKLAAEAGEHVPLESERGYHVVIADGGNTVIHPIMPSDGKMAITPTSQGLRIAGQVELASIDAAPDWRRAKILYRWASLVFHVSIESTKAVDQWMGHRPSTPDGLPCIGAAGSCDGLFYGFGHGHSGVTQAPATAKLIAKLVAGQQPHFDISAMAAHRF